MLKKLAQKIKIHRKKESRYIDSVSDLKRLKAKDAMIKAVVVDETDGSEEIFEKLKKEDTNICLVTKNDKLSGAISDMDLIRLFVEQIKKEPLTKINHGYRRSFVNSSAKDLMKKLTFVHPDTPINEVIKMLEKQRYVPVFDKKVVGVITPSSVLNLLESR